MSSIPQREPLADQIADLIRGSAVLREDIADELADHLASHAEESGIRDPQAAIGEAVKAFGNPQQIARELRAVHLGAQIMLQKIMIVVLLLVVCVMGAVTYFTWSTTREITAQMAGVAKQTGLQLEELNRRLSETKAGPVDQQLPRLKIRCVSGPQQQAVAGCKVTVKSIDSIPAKDSERFRVAEETGRSFTREYLSDAKGEIDSGPLQQGRYQLSGKWEPTLDGEPAGSASWQRTVRLQQMGQVEEVALEIPVTVKYEIRLQGDILKYWDAKRMPAVSLSFFDRSKLPNDCDSEWRASVPIHVAGSSVITGVMSGKPKGPWIQLPLRSHENEFGSGMLSLGPLDLPRDGGPVNVVLSWPADHVSGIVRVDEKGTPARGIPLEVCFGDCVESLHTDEQGRFESQWGWSENQGPGSTPYVVRIPWHTPDGQSAMFEYPIMAPGAEPLEVDLSKLATIRVEFVNTEKVDPRLLMGKSLVANLSWSILKAGEEPGMMAGNSIDLMRRTVDLGPVARTDLLVVPGGYNVSINGLSSRTANSSNSFPSASESVKVEVVPGTKRVVRVDVEKLVNRGHGRSSPPRPVRPSRVIPGADSEDNAITVVEPTTKGS